MGVRYSLEDEWVSGSELERISKDLDTHFFEQGLRLPFIDQICIVDAVNASELGILDEHLRQHLPFPMTTVEYETFTQFFSEQQYRLYGFPPWEITNNIVEDYISARNVIDWSAHYPGNEFEPQIYEDPDEFEAHLLPITKTMDEYCLLESNSYYDDYPEVNSQLERLTQ